MLSPHMRVVAPDMAGFGESDEPKKPWCVDDYVDFIGTFCKSSESYLPLYSDTALAAEL